MKKIFFLLITIFLYAIPNPNINYKMDECSWDNNVNTYEILNSGSSGNDYNATAMNGAYPESGKINNGGNFNTHYMQLKNPFHLDSKWSATFWIKFPLIGSDNQVQINEGWWIFSHYYKVYVIGSVDGTGDIGLFLKDDNGDYQFGVYDNNGDLQYVDIPDLDDGWHFFTIINNGTTTRLYIDGNTHNYYEVNLVTTGNLSLIGTSTDSSNDETIGALMDEFKIWNNYILNDSDISSIYNNENNGKNWDGSTRENVVCPLSSKLIIEYKMDECSWDNDSNTYEILNSGSLGSDYNATAGGDANVTEGKICNGGDINSTTTDKYILPKNNIQLPNSYTLNMWIKLPLNINGHKKFRVGTWWNRKYYYYFNIADRVGSDYDYIYFSYDITDNIWNLCVSDDTDTSCKEFNPQNLNGWHMLTFVVSDNGTSFYLDGDLNETFTTHPNTGELGLIFNSDFGSNVDNQANGQSIGTDVDEFEIFDITIDENQIQTIYNNENSGKNYDGSVRICPNCSTEQQINSTFNAVDYISDITKCNAVSDWDNNITTKLVNKEFNLTILAKNPNTNTPLEANITKVTLYYYNDSSNGKCSGNIVETKTICENCGQTNPNGCMNLDNSNLDISRAVKCVEVNIQGKALSNTLDDTNESNSTDNFAIRPYKFIITKIPTVVKAGNDFNVTVKAVDINGNPVKDYNETIYINGDSVDLEYNETKSNCKTGILSKIDGGNFINGEANITLKYDEVGDVNVTFKEINGSEFAIVDNDDTPDNQRLIAKDFKTISIIPDHFDINVTKINDYDSDYNFTYLDNNISQISGVLELNITAKNKDNETTTNYNEKCYAKDINIRVKKEFLQNDINISKLRYYFVDVNDSKSDIYEIDKDDNISISYKDTNFTTDDNGSTHIKIYLNFDRNISNPSNPFEVNITEINVSDGNISSKIENIGKYRFYYGNIQTNDIVTTEDEVNETIKFLVYSNRDNDNLIPSNTKEIVYNWWENLYHHSIDGNITNIVVSKDYNSSNIQDNVDVSVGNISNGEVTLSIKRNDSSINFVVIHLLSPELSHLWYSRFNNEYNISKGSTCLNHFCFTVTWQNTNEVGEVGSGKFSGTESNITESNSTKRGVKIFR